VLIGVDVVDDVITLAASKEFRNVARMHRNLGLPKLAARSKKLRNASMYSDTATTAS